MPGATCGVPEPFFVATDQEDEDRLNRWGDLCFRGSCPTFVAPADITCVHRCFRAILDRISRGDPRHRHGWGALVAATASSVAVIAALLLTGSATIGIGRLIPMVGVCLTEPQVTQRDQAPLSFTTCRGSSRR